MSATCTKDWTYERRGNGFAVLSEGRIIATINADEADVALMVAAPAMLRTMRDMNVQFGMCVCDNGLSADEMEDEYPEAVEAFRQSDAILGQFKDHCHE